MGKPVIASDVSDLPLILDNAGVVFSPGAVKDLIHSIKTVLYDASASHVMGCAARNRCEQMYSFAVSHRKWLNAVQSIGSGDICV